MISIMALALVIGIGFLAPKAAAQSDKYSTMSPVDQYLMDSETVWQAVSDKFDDATSIGAVQVRGRESKDALRAILVGLANLRSSHQPRRSKYAVLA